MSTGRNCSFYILDELGEWDPMGEVSEINVGTFPRHPFPELPRTYLQATEIPAGIPGRDRDRFVRGSFSIGFGDFRDDGSGQLVDGTGQRVGTVDYRTGAVTFDHPRIYRDFQIVYGRADS